ncbi:ras-related C3 botulinum toxin substrate 1-like [Clavelina lepadiformis]
MEDFESIKIVAVGDVTVGKTSLYSAYATGKPPTGYIPTVFDHHSVPIVLDGIQYTLGLWDSSGDEDYDRLRPLSYHSTDVFLILFSLLDRCSFASVSTRWIPEVRHHCPTAKIILVGMKRDLRDDSASKEILCEQNSKPIGCNEGLQVSTEIGAARYLECSTKTMEGVHDVFAETVRIFRKQDEAKKKKKNKKERCAIF